MLMFAWAAIRAESPHLQNGVLAWCSAQAARDMLFP